MTEGQQQFAGKVAAITGGTQGLGEAAARLLARRGAAGIAICGRNRERGEQVAASIQECPVVFVEADLADMDQGRAFIDATEQRFGRLDVLINCAAATDRGRIETTTEEIWDKLFTLNVKSQFFLIQRAVEVMRRHGIANPYEQLKALTRGRHIGAAELADFVRSLDLPDAARDALLALTPDRYTGNAQSMAESLDDHSA